MRTLTIVAIAGMLCSAFALYGVKYDTRRLQTRVLEQERRIERTVTDIAILRAERAHLSRPDRLQKLAREKLGLRTAKPAQFVRGTELPLHPTLSGAQEAR